MRGKKYVYLMVLVILVISVIGCASEKATFEKEENKNVNDEKEMYELKIVTPWVSHAAEHDVFWLFVDEIESRLGDKIKTNYLGSSEVVAPFDQFEMLGKGVFDLGHLPAAYTRDVAAGDATVLSQLTPSEERESGVYDIWLEQFEEVLNVVYLGSSSGYAYHIYTNFDVNKIEDFEGKTIRVSPITEFVVKALGAGPTTMSGGDIYTALERGVVDGFVWPSLGVVEYGWGEVVKYRLDPGFYDNRIMFFMNKDTWESFPDDIRSELKDIMIDIEKESISYHKQKEKEDTDKLNQQGMKVFELDPRVAGEYLDIAYNSLWEEVIAKDPDLGKTLKNLTTK